jgi:hypothetical protein
LSKYLSALLVALLAVNLFTDTTSVFYCSAFNIFQFMERKYFSILFPMITSDRLMILVSAIRGTASCFVLFYNGVAFFEENKIEAS